MPLILQVPTVHLGGADEAQASEGAGPKQASEELLAPYNNEKGIQASRKVQRWWLNYVALKKIATKLVSQGDRLKSAAEVLSTKSSNGFDDVLEKIQAKELITSVAELSSAVSLRNRAKGGGKLVTPRKVVASRGSSPRPIEMSQQQARKFLTSLMIKHHPDEVINDGDGGSLETMEAKLLRIAADLALVSAISLIDSLDILEAKTKGCLATFRLRLGSFTFAQSFLNAALSVLQSMRANRVAATFLVSYGEAYRYLLDAERADEERLIAVAKQSLEKVKAGIIRVVGREKADKHCASVEEAVDANQPFVVLTPGDLHVPLPVVTPRRSSRSPSKDDEELRTTTTPTQQQPSAAAGSSSSTTRSTPTTPSAGSSSGSAEPEAAAVGAVAEGEAPFAVPQSLAGLLRNEFLAHEILLNPDFKLEEKSMGAGDAGALGGEFAQVKEAMEKMFWDRLVLAMTPAEQEGPDDFIPGAIVQVRFGGLQGSFFAARVEAVNEDGTLDVAYVADGHRERRPISDFRLKSHPLDYEPLLSLIEDVREKLTDLTPKRADLAAELRAKMDTELLGQMTRQGVLDAKAINALLAFVVGRLIALQAPIRAEQTKEWFKGVEAQVQAALSSADSSTSAAFVSLLPGIFKTIFDRIDETKRDIANAHVNILRHFLAQHGVAYERSKFAERLRTGEVHLTNTVGWLRDVMSKPEQAARLNALAQGHSRAHRELLADGLSYLLRLPVRLDTSAAKLPETLFLDGRRLSEVRDEMDRLALIAVYSTLLRQFVVNQKIRTGYAAGEILTSMETRLYTILQDDEGVKLPQLVDEVVASAKLAFKSAQSTFSGVQAATLRGVLNNAASLDNPIFTLLFSRLADVLTVYMRGEEPAARELVGRYGFRPFETQLATAGRRLSRVMEHSLAVYAKLYSRILREEAVRLILERAASASGTRNTSRNTATEVRA